MKFGRIVRRPIAIIALVVVLGAGAWLLVWHMRNLQAESRYDAGIGEAIAMIGLPKEADFHAKLDRIRLFINDHSRHLLDDEFWRMHASGNGNGYLQKLLLHAKGVIDERVHMDCSTRSNLMRNILRRLGYHVRIIAVFNTHDIGDSHTFLEVKNPDTGSWETQDPDFDVYWKSTRTGQRVAIAEKAGNLDEVIPCGPAKCGWDIQGRDGQAADHFRTLLDIITVCRKELESWYALYTPRADLAARFKKGDRQGTFCEVNAKRCKDGFVPIAEQPVVERKVELASEEAREP